MPLANGKKYYNYTELGQQAAIYTNLLPKEKKEIYDNYTFIKE